MGMSAAEKARSGTREWLLQRVANLAIVLWAVVFISRLLMHDGNSFSDWQAFFAPMWFVLYSSITLVLVCFNSVLAGWQIAADYIKAAAVNRLYMLVCIVVSIAYALAGLTILWS